MTPNGVPVSGLTVSREMLISSLPNLPAKCRLEDLPKFWWNHPICWKRQCHKDVGRLQVSLYIDPPELGSWAIPRDHSVFSSRTSCWLGPKSPTPPLNPTTWVLSCRSWLHFKSAQEPRSSKYSNVKEGHITLFLIFCLNSMTCHPFQIMG